MATSIEMKPFFLFDISGQDHQGMAAAFTEGRLARGASTPDIDRDAKRITVAGGCAKVLPMQATAGLWADILANPPARGRAPHSTAPLGPSGRFRPPDASGREIAK